VVEKVISMKGSSLSTARAPTPNPNPEPKGSVKR
jgi:hypothetical protein